MICHVLLTCTFFIYFFKLIEIHMHCCSQVFCIFCHISCIYMTFCITIYYFIANIVLYHLDAIGENRRMMLCHCRIVLHSSILTAGHSSTILLQKKKRHPSKRNKLSKLHCNMYVEYWMYLLTYLSHHHFCKLKSDC